MKILPTAILSGLLCLAGAAHANLIVNGSFENGTQTPVICNAEGECAWVELRATDTPQKLTGWRVDQGVVNWHNSVHPRLPQDGGWMIDLNDTNGASPLARMSQDFATTAGQSYLLSFYLGGPGLTLPNPRQVRVQVGDVDTVLGAAASNSAAMVWELETVAFQATGATTTLSFSSVSSSGYWGAFIDNVSVVADGQVPAPATLMLLGLGLLGLGAARRPS